MSWKVWRKKEPAYNPKHTSSFVKHVAGCVMVGLAWLLLEQAQSFLLTMYFMMVVAE